MEEYFNSIKVRLKQNTARPALGLAEFQFHKGTIKTEGTCVLRHTYYHFNSIKVRLKPCHLVGEHLGPLKFQFHKGTIKTKELVDFGILIIISIP